MMASRMLYVSLPASVLAGALLIGAAPVAWAQCEAAAGAATVEDMATAQPGAGPSAGQNGTAMAESGVETEQGGVTTGAGGEQEAQGALAEQAGDTAMAAVDSPEIEGPDEERVKTLLEEQGYAEVSSIYSCGTYYEAEAMKDGQEETVMVDLSTGRITPQQQQQPQQ